MILGIDEVGRGPWAGPLVVGAVVLGGAQIEGLTDSKKLTKKRREELDLKIREQASGIGLGWVTAEEIDTIGLSSSLILATKRAVEQIKTPFHEIIIDGTVNFLKETNKGAFVTTMKKADLLVPAVSAASIVAKVARDAYMTQQDAVYPGYGFAKHVGYGTAQHVQAINQLGVTPLHRLSIAPLSIYAKKDITPQKPDYRGLSFAGKTTKQIGNQAESKAAEYLAEAGHTIIERNWKTKLCEIDIVSRKDDTIYFVEVKYRSSAQQGGGIAAVTSKKLRQMHYAAGMYRLTHHTDAMNAQLLVVTMNGNLPSVEELIEVM